METFGVYGTFAEQSPSSDLTRIGLHTPTFRSLGLFDWGAAREFSL